MNEHSMAAAWNERYCDCVELPHCIEMFQCFNFMAEYNVNWIERHCMRCKDKENGNFIASACSLIISTTIT